MGRFTQRIMNARHLPSLIAALVVLAAASALALALWLQFAMDYTPCSLCIYQRLANLAVLVIVVMGLFWTGAAQRGLWLLASTYALAGAGLAGWQWHLTAVAAHTVERCAAVNLFPGERSFGPLGKDFASALSGHGSCAAAGIRTLAGWAVTHWSLVFFLACAILLWLAQWLAGRQGKN